MHYTHKNTINISVILDIFQLGKISSFISDSKFKQIILKKFQIINQIIKKVETKVYLTDNIIGLKFMVILKL